MPRHLRTADLKSRSIGGRIASSIFALAFIAFGLFLREQLTPEPSVEPGGASEWERVSCRIAEARVDVNPSDRDPFTPFVRFQYRHGGRDYESSSYYREPRSHDDYTKVWLKLRDLKPGADAFCWVNPVDPAQAAIDPSSPAQQALSIAPFILMGIGGFLLLMTWRPRRAGTTESNAAPGCALLFPLIFAGAGGVMFWLMTIPALRQLFTVSSWVETPCTIVFSELRESRGDDGPTYRADILFSYEYQGEAYRSNRLTLGLKVSSSGSSSKQDKIARHPPGSSAVCHVNPREPWEAVLDKKSPAVLFPLLFPIPFLAAGLFMFFAMLRGGRKARRRVVDPAVFASSSTSNALTPADPVVAPAGPLVLKSGSQRAVKAGCLGFFALFWNGMVFAALLGGGLFSLFLIPFILIGLGLIVATVHQGLAARNARVNLVLTGDPPRAGGTFRIDYLLQGRTHVLESFRITLAAYEVAKYRRGTDTVTKRGCIFRVPLIDTTDPALFARGGADVAIPVQAMPSFKAADNSIEWRFEVRASIPRWPDISDDFDITVLPSAHEE